MAYVPHTPHLGFPPIAATLPASAAAGRSTPGPWLGDIIRAEDPTYGVGEFIYLKGAASTVVGSWVTYNADDWSTTLLAANAIGPVAVAMSANVASQYGWYQIQGKAVGLVLTGFVDDANVYATATAGSVDDAVVAGDRVKNAKGASAIGTPSAGLAEFEIARPWMDDAVAA
ncbi:hypothetical protein FJ872_17855 [Mesorhizobium sp. B2-5-9]|uniref:hypothetical protein n=1 Tax=Mesorhizobium sp. B2-5-9 TaxID=2589921 RepID=UPI00112DAF27|nr:hypothetical protein [Mesorhizobium sp. B2-5-9]TPK16667.1 hypothetical protein FJ872_17855 [Mesorhizobium sp. B2-5-9]